VLVPIDAIRDLDAAQPWALKLVGARVHRQNLRLGLRGGGLAEVIEGLAAGDLVVAGGYAEVMDRTRIRPVFATPAPIALLP